MAADTRFRDALRAVAASLEQISAPAMIIGGVAVIAAGIPRETLDIDAVIRGRDSDVEDVLAVFRRNGVVGRVADVREAVRERNVLLLRHERSSVDVDVAFGWLPFEEEALMRAAEVDAGGVIVRVADPEDLIIYKAAAWRDRDRSDIERLLNIHIDRVDLGRIHSLVSEIAEVLDDPTRLAGFDAIVQRVRNIR